jgi:hypothetical protein
MRVYAVAGHLALTVMVEWFIAFVEALINLFSRFNLFRYLASGQYREQARARLGGRLALAVAGQLIACLAILAVLGLAILSLARR